VDGGAVGILRKDAGGAAFFMALFLLDMDEH